MLLGLAVFNFFQESFHELSEYIKRVPIIKFPIHFLKSKIGHLF